MKLHKLTCPNCNGSLDMNVDETTTSIFCPYCGQKFFLDDEKRECTINKNIHKRYTNDAEVIKAYSADKENRRSWIAVLVIWLILIVMMVSLLLVPELKKRSAISAGKICAGFYRDLLGENYQTVIAHFEAAGFTNIELIDLNDAGIAFWTEGDVVTISVGGDTSFDTLDFFYPDTKVVISYH